MDTEECETKIYTCPGCMMTFEKSKCFKKHMKNQHSIMIFVCSNCPQYFHDLGKLYLHARRVHHAKHRITEIVKKHQCKYEKCNYQTDNGGLHRHHMLSHLEIKPYVCKVCNKRFTQKSNMKTHFHRHKKHENQFTCEECEKEFNSHDTFLSHLSTREHHLGIIGATKMVHFQCLVCLKEFNMPEDIHEHIFNCQLSVSFPVSCMTCFYKLPHDLEAIQNHSKSHKNELVCPSCPEYTVFNDKTKFNFHLTKIHGDKVVRRPACRYCELTFANEEEKNAHIIHEHNELKYKHLSRGEMGRIMCGIKGCDFSTNSEIYLQKHILQHVGKNDPDLYYNGNVKIESTEHTREILKPRKRGRPRLCDQTINSLSSSCRTDDSNEFMEIRRKRGRPRKHELKEEPTSNEIKKRGRPKKIQNNNNEYIGNTSDHRMEMEPVLFDQEEDFINYDIDEFDRILADRFENPKIPKIEIFENNALKYNFDDSINIDSFNNFEEFDQFLWKDK